MFLQSNSIVLVHEESLFIFLYSSLRDAYHSIMTKLKTITLGALLTAFLIPSISFGATKEVCDLPSEEESVCFDEKTLTTSKTKPSLKGLADGVEKIRVIITEEDKTVWKSKIISVKKSGSWLASVKKKLEDGSYDVAVYEKSNLKEPLATETLTIGKTSASSPSKSSSSASVSSAKGDSIAASPITLLFGGTAARSGKVPVAYVQLENKGKKTTAIEGFTLTQNGTAAGAKISAFETADDKGGSRTMVSNKDGDLFKGKDAYIPLKATLAPGQIRIFTILAVVDKSAVVGSTLKLDVKDIKTNATVGGKLPMKGTTWTIK